MSVREAVEQYGDPVGGGPGVGEERRSWAGVAKGLAQPVRWTSEKASEAEVAALQRHFPTILEFPPEEFEAAKGQWEGRSLIVRSLGRRVPPEWVAREVHQRAALEAAPEVFALVEEYLVLRFGSPADCERVLFEGSWVVAGQLLATERWVADFVSGRSSIRRATIWMRLPGLPLEYWDPAFLQRITALAGHPLALDVFKEQGRKAGYAWIRVEVDTMELLCPGVSIRGRAGVFWQPFAYESIPVLCFGCGQMSHSVEACSYRDDRAEGGEAETEEKPRFSPWMVTSRIRAPWPTPAGPRPTLEGRPSQASAEPSATPPVRSRALETNGVPPGPPPASADWHKPAKVAWRQPAVPRKEGALGGEDDPGQFRALMVVEPDPGSGSGSEVMAFDPLELGSSSYRPSPQKRPRSSSLSSQASAKPARKAGGQEGRSGALLALPRPCEPAQTHPAPALPAPPGAGVAQTGRECGGSGGRSDRLRFPGRGPSALAGTGGETVMGSSGKSPLPGSSPNMQGEVRGPVELGEETGPR